MKEYDEVIILIGSSETDFVYDWNNPLSTGERIELIRSCFSKSELSRLIITHLRDFDNDPLWRENVVKSVPEFEAVYSNNQVVIDLFKDFSYNPPINYFFFVPETLYAKPKQIKVLTGFYDEEKYNGTKIRVLMVNRGNWKKLVPKGSVELLEGYAIESRLRRPKR